jgi:hypothetical protein
VADPFIQRIDGLDLTIEQATERTPDKSKFHVYSDGELVGSHKTLGAAQKQFKELRDASGWTPPQKEDLSPQEMLVREREMHQRLAHLEYWSTSHRFRGGGRPKRK